MIKKRLFVIGVTILVLFSLSAFVNNKFFSNQGESSLSPVATGSGSLSAQDQSSLSTVAPDSKALSSQDESLHPITYSREELEHISNKLSAKMIELGIKFMAIDETTNRVKVYLDKIDASKISKIKKVIDSPAIEFIEQEINMSY